MVFFFNDTATTEIYTLSLHDALPICLATRAWTVWRRSPARAVPTASRSRRASRARRSARRSQRPGRPGCRSRSEEHTSELQSRQYLVCRLLLEKKKRLVSYVL